jgi:MFS family permease
MSTVTGARRTVFVGLLFGAMGAATLAAPSLGILATFIIDDLSISRSLLGWVIAANIVLAAVLSPLTGGVIDRIGGKAGLIALFVVVAVSFVTFGYTPAVGVLFLAAMIAAVAQSAANPATNKLIGEDLPPGERGVITGIKQSGVQAAITAAGLVLPTAAIAIGWRGAMLLLTFLPLLGALVAVVVIPASEHRSIEAHESAGRLPPSIPWLATYGLAIGFSGAVTFFIPLFAEESLGLDPRIGGLAVAALALTAFAARILWARHSERRHDFLGPLGTIAILATIASTLLLGATGWAWLLWPGAVLTGASSSAWNSVGMLAVINDAGAGTGRASGIVLFGFLTGLGIGPPIYGATVDATGSYTVMWLMSIGAAAITIGIVWMWRRTLAAQNGSAAVG